MRFLSDLVLRKHSWSMTFTCFTQSVIHDSSAEVLWFSISEHQPSICATRRLARSLQASTSHWASDAHSSCVSPRMAGSAAGGGFAGGVAGGGEPEPHAARRTAAVERRLVRMAALRENTRRY